MRILRMRRWLSILGSGVLLFGFLGCLGPNPGFFIGSSIANATIFTIVSTVLGRAITNFLAFVGL